MSEGGFIFFKAPEPSKWNRSDVDQMINDYAPYLMIDIYQVHNQTSHVVTFIKCENSKAPNKLFIDSSPTDLSLDLAPNQKLYFVKFDYKLFLRCHDQEIVQYFEIGPKEVNVQECILPENRYEDIIGYQTIKKHSWVSLQII